MNTSDFTSNFWNIYIAVILIVSFIGMIWLLVSQNKTKKTGSGQVETMGHEWDGIQEYNNPLPRWWFYLFVITVVFSIVYLILYPGFASFKGVWNWTSHNQYEREMHDARLKYKKVYDEFANMSIPDIAKNPKAKQIGYNLFNTYCIQCHGSDAKGAKGFPNLTDHDWLWGGDPEQIQESIRDGRMGVMQPYGGLDPFPDDSVKDVANYVVSLNENPEFRSRANPERAKRGKAIFDQICFTCHQEDGKGMVGLAPNLTDDVWLWGSRDKDIEKTIMHGHTNEMPAWANFLIEKDADGTEDPSKLRILTAYVWGLSNTGPNAKPVENVSSDTQAVAETEEVAATEEASEDVNIVVEDGVVSFYFATGKAQVALNEAANNALADIIQGVQDGKKAVISGYTDATGDPERNEELAKERAVSVRDALLNNGVPEDMIELKKPESITADGSNELARRVEVTLQ